MPEIVECFRGTGEDSFIFKVYVVSVEHLKEVIDRLTPFGMTSTSIVLTSVVERNLLGPRNLNWPPTKSRSTITSSELSLKKK
jgi:Lrp/AsnC family leucine-responsive transcriptional regulator